MKHLDLAVIAAFATLLAGAAFAQQAVLKEENVENGATVYLDGGAAGGDAVQNRGRIVRIERWVCPPDALRPIAGAVQFVDARQRIDRMITLPPRQCLLRYFDPTEGVEIDQLVDMVRNVDNAIFIAVGTQGDALAAGAPASISAAAAAAAASAAAAGYYNSCSSSGFDLLSLPIPNPKKNPAEYACFSGYAAHAH